MLPITKKTETPNAVAAEEITAPGQEPKKSNPSPAVLDTPAAAPGVKVAQAAPSADLKAEMQAAAARTSQAMQKVAKDQWRFISVYPTLTIYVYLGLMEIVDGNHRPAPSKITFKNGGFITDDPKVAEAMRAHKKCNTQLFREVDNADAAARMIVTQQAEDQMRTPTFAGVTGSSDGGEMEYLQRQAALQAQKAHAFHGG